MKRFATQSSLFGFTTKIVLLILGTLLIYQGLGTLLNILTLEQIYLKGLTAKYRIIGDDLKNEIEGALKFGKRLDQFVGMDRIVSRLFTEHTDLETIFLLNTSGKSLYRSGRAEFVVAQGGADIGDDGQRTLTEGSFTTAMNTLPDNFNGGASQANLFSQGDAFYLLFPIQPRFGDEAGVLGLAFNKKIFTEQRSRIMVAEGKLLAITLLLTLLVIGIYLYCFTLRSTHRQVDSCCRLLKSGLDNLQEPGPETVAEIHDLQTRMVCFAKSAGAAMDNVSARLQALQDTQIEQPQEREIVNQMQVLLKDKDND